MTTEHKKFSIEEYAARHRPETAAFIRSIAGEELSLDTYIMRYRALGLPRSSPSKIKHVYKFLVKVGFIKGVN